jgi:hypothetical protein
MEKKIAGLLGAMATLGAVNAAQASQAPSPAPTEAMRANSFADLLEPIPNAASLLQAIDESEPNVQLAQGVYIGLGARHHHHHHHHHHAYRRRIVVMPPRFRHHHHHHHHHGYYRRD